MMQQDDLTQVLSLFQRGHINALLCIAQPIETAVQLTHAIAAALLCQVSKQAVACGQCQSCQWLNAKAHPDQLLIQPEKNTITLDQAKRISDFSVQSGRRVVIIDKAQCLNQHAANALLKTLEEPHGDVVFLLSCEAPSLLPPALVSRCLSYRCAVPEGHKSNDHQGDLIDIVFNSRPAWAEDFYQQYAITDQQCCQFFMQVSQELEGLQSISMLVLIDFWQAVLLAMLHPRRRIQLEQHFGDIMAQSPLNQHDILERIDRLQQLKKTEMAGHHLNSMLQIKSLNI